MSSGTTDADTLAHLHPLARNAWSQLRDRSSADRRLVFEALCRRLSRGGTSANAALAITALQRFAAARKAARRAADESGEELPPWAKGTPSKRNYNAFRDAQPNRAPWPSTQLIANAHLNCWPEALAAAGLAPAPSPLALRRTSMTIPKNNDELLDHVRRWVQEVDRHDPQAPLSRSVFSRWLVARRRAETSSATPTIKSFDGRIGQWSKVLAHLGELSREPTVTKGRQRLASSPLRSWAESVVAGIDLSKCPGWGERCQVSGRGRKSSPGREEIVAWIRWLTGGLNKADAAALTRVRWDALRDAIHQRLAESGQLVLVPAASVISDHSMISGWSRAKVAAGIATAEPNLTQAQTNRYERSELIEAVANAKEDLGSVPSFSQYVDYRRKALASEADGSPWRRIPTQTTLREHLGGPNATWQGVCDALAESEKAKTDVKQLDD